MDKVFENPHTEIYSISNEIPNTVFADWKGYLNMQEPKAIETCEVSLEYFKEEKIKIMISDHKYLEGATVEFLTWLQDYYYPTIFKNDLHTEIRLDSNIDMG